MWSEQSNKGKISNQQIISASAAPEIRSRSDTTPIVGVFLSGDQRHLHLLCFSILYVVAGLCKSGRLVDITQRVQILGNRQPRHAENGHSSNTTTVRDISLCRRDRHIGWSIRSRVLSTRYIGTRSVDFWLYSRIASQAVTRAYFVGFRASRKSYQSPPL